MKEPEGIENTPWDARALEVDAFEIKAPSEDALKWALSRPGHYTVRVDPLLPKKLLHQYGFYYCDTLIEPYCSRSGFTAFHLNDAQASKASDIEAARIMCRGTFRHDRYHRDFNVDETRADLRYEFWLRDIHESGTLLYFFFRDKFAGFFGYSGNRIALHALTEEFRGKGLAKYFWSAACESMFAERHEELVSSISAANTSALNLYSSIGFRFRNPKDIYHLLVS